MASTTVLSRIKGKVFASISFCATIIQVGFMGAAVGIWELVFGCLTLFGTYIMLPAKHDSEETFTIIP